MGTERVHQGSETGDCVYRETFDSGSGGWTVGKNDENGSWHRNVFGFRGEGAPLTWHRSGGKGGGFASSESPWYFDDNHGGFSWFHLALRVPNSSDIGLAGADLRNAIFSITLRGTDLKLREKRQVRRLLPRQRRSLQLGAPVTVDNGRAPGW